LLIHSSQQGRGRKEDEYLMEQDKDKEITYCPGQNRLDMGKINLIYCQIKME